MSTKAEYIAAGYRISAQVSDEQIAKIEADVTESYIDPIYETSETIAAITEAVMQITFIILLQKSAVVTRAGGKVKTSPSLSVDGYPSQEDYTNADRLLQKVQSLEDATEGNISEIVDDIAGIYYRNAFLSL